MFHLSFSLRNRFTAELYGFKYDKMPSQDTQLSVELHMLNLTTQKGHSVGGIFYANLRFHNVGFTEKILKPTHYGQPSHHP